VVRTVQRHSGHRASGHARSQANATRPRAAMESAAPVQAVLSIARANCRACVQDPAGTACGRRNRQTPSMRVPAHGTGPKVASSNGPTPTPLRNRGLAAW